MDRAEEKPVKKKPYNAPTLVRYGDLLEVTQAIPGGTGKSDSAKASNKTG